MTFKELFNGQRPIIGIQDCGCTMQYSTYEKIQRDIDIFMKNGVIPLVKNVRGYVEDIKDALAYLDDEYHGSVYGVNVPKHWDYAFHLAAEYNASFISIDEIDIMPEMEDGFWETLSDLKDAHKNIVVMGSMVYPRYSDLGFEGELINVSNHCDAIIYMGDRADVTMMNGKIDEIKTVLKAFPVLMGEDFTEDQCLEGYLRGDGAVLDAWLKDHRSVLGNVYEPYVAEIAEANSSREN